MRHSKRPAHRPLDGPARRRQRRLGNQKKKRSLRNVFLESLERRDLLSVTISNFHLVNDTGASNSDLVTTDPRVTATVGGTFSFSGGSAAVQFDHNGDGTHEGAANIAMSGQSFTYDPRTTDPSLESYTGLFNLRYRSVEYNSSQVVVSTGSWITYAYTLEQAPSEIDVLDGMMNLTDGVSSVSFGSTTTGSALTRTFTVKNVGAGPLTVDTGSFTLPSGFTVLSLPAATVAPNATTTFSVRLDAVSPGTYSGALSFGNNDANENPFNFTISGTVNGTSSPEIEVRDSGLNLTDGTSQVEFGQTTTGTPQTKTFTVFNVGQATLTLDAGNITLPAGFSLLSGPAVSVSPTTSTTFTVRLDAASTGNYSGQLSLGNNDSNENPFNFTIAGSVVAPTPEIKLELAGTDLADGVSTVEYGTTAIGTPVSKTLTIRNVGQSSLTINAAAMSVPSGFTLVSLPADTLAADASSTFVVRLDASALGSYTGQLTIENNDGDENPFNVTLSGVVAGPPEIDLRDGGVSLVDGTASVDLGGTVVGQAVSRTFTVHNLGESALSLESGSVGLPSGFSVVTAPASSVAPGGSTSFTVRLDATTAGAYTGQLSLASSDTDENPFNFTLSGTVSEPTPVVSIDSIRNAAEGGQTGYFRLLRTAGISQELTVAYHIDTGASQATPGADFSYLSGTSSAQPYSGSVTFGAGAAQVDISVASINDTAEEAEESLRIVLDEAAEYDLGTPVAATIVIGDSVQSLLSTVTIGRLVSEVQSLVLPDASGGTWTLSLDGQSAPPLANGAAAIDVQGALEGLANVGIGNVLVTGDGTFASPYLVTFRSALIHSNLPQIAVDGTGLTGIAGPAASVTTEIQGVNGPNEVHEVVIRSLDPNAALATSGGYIRFYWGAPGPGQPPDSDLPRRSPAVLWNAALTQIEDAIEQIQNVATAGGSVTVTELSSTAIERRLRVEFTGGLASQDITDLTAQNDSETGSVRDINGLDGAVEFSKVADGEPGPTSEVQEVALAHVQGGYFTLAYLSESTTPIDFNSTAAIVQARLGALNGVGEANIAVTGPAGGPWRIEFLGAMAGRDLPSLSIDGVNLSGGQVIVHTLSSGGTTVEATQDAVEAQAFFASIAAVLQPRR